MVATTSIRTRVRNEILRRIALKPALDGVTITPGLPGKAIEREHVFVPRITGERKVRFMEAGRKTVDDDFTITVVFMTAQPGAGIDESDDRVEQMGGALEDVLADDPGLNDENDQPMDGLMWAVSARWDGPDHELTDEGAVSFLRADIDCKARYLGGGAP